jgi:hypothetical protein
VHWKYIWDNNLALRPTYCVTYAITVKYRFTYNNHTYFEEEEKIIIQNVTF